MKLAKLLHPSDNAIAIILSIGICLFPIHNDSLTFGNSKETYFFLPWVGIALIMIGLISLYDGKFKNIKENLGPKIVYIPMLGIVASGFARVFVDFSAETITSGFFLLGLFLLYTAARKLGLKILIVLFPFVVVEAISCIIYGIADSGVRAGGILTSEGGEFNSANYDIATAWLIMGTCFLLWRKEVKSYWYLALIAIALFFVASEEAIFALVVLGGFALLRRDYSKKLILPVALLIIFVIGGVALDVTQDLYKPTEDKINSFFNWESSDSVHGSQWDDVTTGRWEVYKNAIENIEPLGHGYEVDNFTYDTVHNVPLIIVDQIGVLAALCWLVVTLYCLIKTSWKYAFVAVLALSFWDHYIFTQLAPWWWILIGLATTVDIDDRIFINKGIK